MQSHRDICRLSVNDVADDGRQFTDNQQLLQPGVASCRHTHHHPQQLQPLQSQYSPCGQLQSTTPFSRDVQQQQQQLSAPRLPIAGDYYSERLAHDGNEYDNRAAYAAAANHGAMHYDVDGFQSTSGSWSSRHPATLDFGRDEYTNNNNNIWPSIVRLQQLQQPRCSSETTTRRFDGQLRQHSAPYDPSQYNTNYAAGGGSLFVERRFENAVSPPASLNYSRRLPIKQENDERSALTTSFEFGQGQGRGQERLHAQYGSSLHSSSTTYYSAHNSSSSRSSVKANHQLMYNHSSFNNRPPPSSSLKNIAGRTRGRRPAEGRPPFTYVQLIRMALGSARLTLREITDVIERMFPFFAEDRQPRPSSMSASGTTSSSSVADWRAAVRHSLTTNDCFVKHDRERRSTGCRWSYDPSAGTGRRKYVGRKAAGRKQSFGEDGEGNVVVVKGGKTGAGDSDGRGVLDVLGSTGQQQSGYYGRSVGSAERSQAFCYIRPHDNQSKADHDDVISNRFASSEKFPVSRSSLTGHQLNRPLVTTYRATPSSNDVTGPWNAVAPFPVTAAVVPSASRVHVALNNDNEVSSWSRIQWQPEVIKPSNSRHPVDYCHRGTTQYVGCRDADLVGGNLNSDVSADTIRHYNIEEEDEEEEDDDDDDAYFDDGDDVVVPPWFVDPTTSNTAAERSATVWNAVNRRLTTDHITGCVDDGNSWIPMFDDD